MVYNANEAGNYLWGMVLEYHGIFPNPNWIAEAGTSGRPDEPWEQRAITKGKNKGISLLNKANRDNSIKETILGNRLDYRLYYNWYD
ncbi:MAG: hypothetical protein LBV74_16505 [Tannerella sp.]|jgi:hypothetical protein|nr:hypothetical protein [Tannerella sp.]